MRVLGLVLALSLSPGIAEATEDLGHRLALGHTVHAQSASAAEAATHDDREHGCTPLFHLCGCHSPAPSMVTIPPALERDQVTAEIEGVVIPADERRPLERALGQSLRPPIA